MTERGILFSAPMVRALLDGSKTQTRRVCKSQPFDRSYSKHDHRMGYASGRVADGDEIDGFFAYSTSSGGQWQLKCPYGQPGDRLWVRETWYCDDFRVQRGPYVRPDDLDVDEARTTGVLVYAADGVAPYEAEQPTWKPSIHMPRWASRILLEITGVRIERLQDISNEDARAEGVMPAYADQCVQAGHPYNAVPLYRDLWNAINGAGSWDANPWVWVVEFRRVES